MKYHVLGVYDSKAGAFSTPFYVPAVGVALRAFTEAANTPDHPVGKNPTDYCLFLLGTFDDGTGVHELLPEHKNLGLASNFKQEHAHVRQVA